MAEVSATLGAADRDKADRDKAERDIAERDKAERAREADEPRSLVVKFGADRETTNAPTPGPSLRAGRGGTRQSHLYNPIASWSKCHTNTATRSRRERA